MAMRVSIIGAGGVGGYYSAVLARGGIDVTIVTRPGKADLLRRGLRVTDRGESFETSNFRVVSDISKLAAPELIIVATKTYHLPEVAEQLTSVVGDDTAILTLQNGVEADLQISRRLRRGMIFPGLTWILSHSSETGVIDQRGARTFIRFGDRRNEHGETLARIAETLNTGGVDARISQDIVSDLWQKFLWLSNFAGMTGSRRAPIGELVNDPKELQLWIQAIDEVLAVARAERVALPTGVRDYLLERLNSYKTTNSDFKPSLLIDLENGRRTEVDALSGTVLRIAEKHGLAAPMHREFYARIKQFEPNAQQT